MTSGGGQREWLARAMQTIPTDLGRRLDRRNQDDAHWAAVSAMHPSSITRIARSARQAKASEGSLEISKSTRAS
jgi:hypothetical protein